MVVKVAVAKLIVVLKADLEKAEAVRKEAEEVFEFARVAGIDVSEQRRRFLEAVARVDRIKAAIEAREG